MLSCVGDTPDVEAVLFGEGGVAGRVTSGQLVVDLSTISPKKTREFADRFSALGVDFLDAPVSGGSEGAERGTLSVMVGGNAEALERARPVLEAFGKTIVHVGPSGSGQLVKLVNQILVAGSMLSMAEGLLFAQASGLDLTKTLEVVTAWCRQQLDPPKPRPDARAPRFFVLGSRSIFNKGFAARARSRGRARGTAPGDLDPRFTITAPFSSTAAEATAATPWSRRSSCSRALPWAANSKESSHVARCNQGQDVQRDEGRKCR